MPLSPVEEKDLPAIRCLIAAAVRASVAQSEDEATFLIEDIDKSLVWWQRNQSASVHLKWVEGEATVGAVLVKEFWNLANCFVAPDFQARSIGRHLVAAALGHCRERSPRAAVLVNSSTNAAGFYRRLGFVQAGPPRNLPGGCIPFRYEFVGGEASGAAPRAGKSPP